MQVNNDSMAMNHSDAILTTLDGLHHNLNSDIPQDFRRSLSPVLIAKVLSQINRWNGNTGIPVNVAWHSVAVFRNLLVMNQSKFQELTIEALCWLLLKTLFHDASEMITGDISRPIKQTIKDNEANTMNHLNKLDARINEGVKLSLLDELQVYLYEKEGNGKKFFELLKSRQDLWDNLNVVHEFVKRSDLDVAEIEFWLWQKPFSSTYSLRCANGTIVHETIEEQKNEFAKNTKQLGYTSINDRYWYALCSKRYIQGDLFSNSITFDTQNYDLATESMYGFIKTYQRLLEFINICSDRVIDPKEVNLDKFFFGGIGGYKEQIEAI